MARPGSGQGGRRPPRRPGFASEFEDDSPGSPGRAPPPSGARAAPKEALEHQTEAQRNLLRSGFEEDSPRPKAVLGSANRAPGEDEDTPVDASFDGKTPDPSLTSRDVWKAINAPVQSREGRRSRARYRLVINQFAVGQNPRYEPDAPEKPRAHLFVWDVTRAMNVEVPHFVGAKELTLAQTCDWIRHEGPMRGWRRADPESALQAANAGHPVLAIPKAIKEKLIAVVGPGRAGPDGEPLLCAAGQKRGNRLSTRDALGVSAVEYFVHE